MLHSHLALYAVKPTEDALEQVRTDNKLPSVLGDIGFTEETDIDLDLGTNSYGYRFTSGDKAITILSTYNLEAQTHTLFATISSTEPQHVTRPLDAFLDMRGYRTKIF